MANLSTQTVSYKAGSTELEGFLVEPSVVPGKKRPAVIVIHQWLGLSDYEKERAKMLAEKGYVVLAADIYGKGVRPKNPAEAGPIAGQFKGDRKLYRERIKAALDYLSKNQQVDNKHIVVMGYCFGGMGALEAGRAGFPIAGAVSFHGDLSNPSPKDAGNLKMPVLILHGAVDPYVKDQVLAFQDEMNLAKVDYQFISYANAVHAFTEKHAGNDPSNGAAYNEKADKRSWIAFQQFLNEVAPVK